jgi:hypothetical protein
LQIRLRRFDSDPSLHYSHNGSMISEGYGHLETVAP